MEHVADPTVRGLATAEHPDRHLEALELRFDAVEHRLIAMLDELSSLVDRRLRAQTWIMTGTLLTGIGVALAVGQAA